MEIHAASHPSRRRETVMDSNITTRFRLVAVAAGLGITADAASLEIVFSDLTPGTHSTQMIAGFEDAAALWESALLDPVTVRIDVAFQALDVGTTAAAGSSSNAYSYSAVRSALLADAASLDDGAAIGSLENDSDFQFVVRDVNDASTLLYVFSEQSGVDAWNTTLDVNRANAKSLALLTDDNATDGTIVISSEVDFDFDRSDGINPGSFDFVGVAAHYVGHILGFVSGVDAIDFVSTPDGQAAGCCNTIGSRRFTAGLKTSAPLKASVKSWRRRSTPLFTVTNESNLQYSQSADRDANPADSRVSGAVLRGHSLGAQPDRHRDVRRGRDHRLARRLPGAPAAPDLGLRRLPRPGGRQVSSSCPRLLVLVHLARAMSSSP